MTDRWRIGHITTEHTVWCGVRLLEQHPAWYLDDYCDDHWQFSDRRPAKTARSGGWVLMRQFGWVCPPCAFRIKQDRKEKGL